MATPLCVLVLAKERVTRDVIRQAIVGDSRLTLVVESGDELEAIMMSEKHQPDIVLFDLALKKMTPERVSALIKQSCPRAEIVLLTNCPSEGEQGQTASVSHVSAVLAKEDIPGRLLSVLHSLLKNKPDKSN